MKFLVAQQTPTTLDFSVWLDETKGTASAPDPTWVLSWSFPVNPPTGWKGGSINGTAYASWSDYVTTEVQLLAKQAYDQLTADPTPLSVQGTSF